MMTPLLKEIFDPFEPEPHGIGALIIKILVDAIDDGRLQPSMALPSVRKLAEHLKISRRTTERAYKEMKDNGLLQVVKGGATIVAAVLPPVVPALVDMNPTGFLAHGRLINFDQVTPLRSSVKQLNKDLLRHTLNADQVKKTEKMLNWYTESCAKVRININLCQCTNYTEGELSISYGYKQVLANLPLTFLNARQIVVVAETCTNIAHDALQAAGNEVKIIREDEMGMVTTDLEELCKRGKRKIGMVYVNSRANHMGNRELAAERIAHLLTLSCTYGFLIVEDDQHVHADASSPNPLMKAVQKKAVQTIYISPYTFVHSAINVFTVICGATGDLKKLTRQLDIATDSLPFEMFYALHQVTSSGQLSHTEKTVKLGYEKKLLLANTVLQDSGLWLVEAPLDASSCFITFKPVHELFPAHFFRTLEKQNIYLINPARMLVGQHSDQRIILSIAAYLSDDHLEEHVHLLNEKAKPIFKYN